MNPKDKLDKLINEYETDVFCCSDEENGIDHSKLQPEREKFKSKILLRSDVEEALKEDGHNCKTITYCFDCMRRDGYNQAIKEIRQKLGIGDKK